MEEGVGTLDPGRIAQEYGPFVSALCRRAIRDPQTAEDAAQEAWTQILLALPSFRAQAQVSTWIYRIVVRQLSAFLAREQRYSTRFLRTVFHAEALESPYDHRDRTAQWAREQCDQCLTGIVHCLDSESRLVFLFREVAALGWAEVAAILDRDETAVRQVGSRGKRRVRAFMDGECSLLNPEGPCRCRMARVVKAVDLPREYEGIRRLLDRLRLFRQAETLVPRRNFWLEAVTKEREGPPTPSNRP